MLPPHPALHGHDPPEVGRLGLARAAVAAVAAYVDVGKRGGGWEEAGIGVNDPVVAAAAASGRVQGRVGRALRPAASAFPPPAEEEGEPPPLLFVAQQIGGGDRVRGHPGVVVVDVEPVPRRGGGGGGGEALPQRPQLLQGGLLPGPRLERSQ